MFSPNPMAETRGVFHQYLSTDNCQRWLNLTNQRPGKYSVTIELSVKMILVGENHRLIVSTKASYITRWQIVEKASIWLKNSDDKSIKPMSLSKVMSSSLVLSGFWLRFFTLLCTLFSPRGNIPAGHYRYMVGCECGVHERGCICP